MDFTVNGRPQPQGSKVKGRWGGVHEDNPALEPWRDSVVVAARAAMAATNGTSYPLSGAVTVCVDFYFGRPRSHYGTGRNSDAIRAGAPKSHQQKPDLDKLQRALGDALVMAGLLRDDCQIVGWQAAKWWDARPYMWVDLGVVE